MDKQTVVHLDSGILISAKKKWAKKPGKEWRDLKCLLLNEKEPIQKGCNTVGFQL